jgi:hypothetical protein
VKNRLSPSLIGLSPLTTNLPSILLHTRVRSSKTCYWIFNLFIARSLGFRFDTYNFYLSLYDYLNLLYDINLLTHYAKGTLLFWIIPKLQIKFRHLIYVITTYNCSYPYGIFHLSLTVLIYYRLKETFSLEGGTPFFIQCSIVLLKLL